jgi:hypothetical protein
MVVSFDPLRVENFVGGSRSPLMADGYLAA